MTKSAVNEYELRKAIEQLYPKDEEKTFEIRIIGGRNKKPISGYFQDADTLIEQLKKVNLDGVNVYITLQQLTEEMFSRVQSEHFMQGVETTSDNNIVGYKWLFVDLDPVRATGVSSSDEELKEATELAHKVYNYLKDMGFEEPVIAMSGNGMHLLYRIRLENNTENKDLIQKCLNALAMMFDTDKVKVDTANFNPSRICKLYGTLAQKGSDRPKRPHRMSRIYGDKKDVKITSKAYLQKLAAEIPDDPPRPSKRNDYHPTEFDVESWMDQHGLRYKVSEYKGGTKYILDECPFDSAHKAPDAMVTRSSSGAIGFKCLHNSCSGYHWRDLRLKFEPDAYDISDDDRRITEGYLRHNREREAEILHRQNVRVTEDEPLFLNAAMIYQTEEPEGEFIKTGINEIDKRLKGLQKGCVTAISGLRGAAKSTLLSQIVLNCIQEKHTSIIYSGELSSKRFMRWIYMQAAGKSYTKEYDMFQGSYYCPEDIKQSINTWMGDYMWLYNNHYGNEFSKIGQQLRKEILAHAADFCIVDNLMALDLSHFDTDKYDAQTKFVWELKDIAETCNVHVIFVAHPRKAMGFLRLDDISGSGNIGNIIDNALIVHRNNADFQRMTKQMFGWKADNDAYAGTNVIEVCKDRDGGLQDYFIPLWYEAETKRLKNYSAENVIYGWDKPDDGFVDIDDMEELKF